ncbi:MogA/MoaB family molybdenum cofactor biosynthesis protein [Actinomyces sp. S4-C9]|uniref:MogA/MoaB family molybdenum cofactor biosynthesis protein n=1 Tax=Actinomyces sp. S4-C9 TaxID=1219581 RepID=UPI00050F9F3B|nr:MogA/MoaB family molybdenum cofactor biosynthesis protein [Actinomyces sp. S4-C9]KGF02761.1 molybdopterin biosynthesis Mog protein [Actinomyces sp. S4-C9]
MTDLKLPGITAAVITVDSRVVSGVKEPKGAQTAVSIMEDAGIEVVREVIIDDLAAPLRGEFDRALEAGARLIITIGSTGISARNIVPETTLAVCDVELPGIAEQIRQEGLKNTPLAVLSRAVVGVTSRTSKGAVIVNCPSSSGGVKDALAVLLPLLRYIYEQLDQTEA